MFNTFLKKMKNRRKTNRARRELHSLTNRELKDIGIRRCDIDFI